MFMGAVHVGHHAKSIDMTWQLAQLYPKVGTGERRGLLPGQRRNAGPSVLHRLPAPPHPCAAAFAEPHLRLQARAYAQEELERKGVLRLGELDAQVGAGLPGRAAVGVRGCRGAGPTPWLGGTGWCAKGLPNVLCCCPYCWPATAIACY